MQMRIPSALGMVGLGLLALAQPAQAQQPANDGFRRLHGQMEVLRNGRARPMTRDVHLPTGATVTKDGFVVSPTGQRTELREGQGCDLRGQLVVVRPAPDGKVALAAPAGTVNARPPRTPPVRSTPVPEASDRREENDKRFFKVKKRKKHRGKGRGRWKGGDDD